MTTHTNDPLLLAGKVATIFAQIAMAIGATALVIGLPIVIFLQDKIIGGLQEKAGSPDLLFPMFALIGIMLIGLATVVALFIFFGKLRAIIGTVGDGDPFQPANADRLSMMGWLMLGVQLIMFPAAALGVYLARFADEVEDMHLSVDGGFDLTGILLVIILFILARVFRHGAAMRDDLEGTV